MLIYLELEENTPHPSAYPLSIIEDVEFIYKLV